MNPFGTPAKCPRCEKTVYAAEQIIGPGRQVYHKFCLKCTSCNKRLDSYSLVEHDNEPYCKGCHVRGFGTRDLRHQNLARASPPGSPSSGKASSPSSPQSINTIADRFNTFPLRHVQNDPPLTPPRTISPVTENQETEPEPHPDPSELEPTTATFVAEPESETMLVDEPTKAEREIPAASSPPPLPRRTPSIKNTYSHEYRSSKPSTPSRFPAPLSPSAIRKGSTGFAALRAGPPSPRRFGFGADGVGAGAGETPSTPIGMRASASSPARPLSQTPTGAGIRPMMTGGSMSASPVRPMMTGGTFGGSARVECPRCGKVVYHAEQVTGPGGRKYHKPCLRCVQCNSSLDSGKLTEKDGEPMCRNCYSKTHGPQGAGYALIGRAG
ncbi:hypothetical protein BDV93DRAFT_474759 [Ceratobasidium sp. AG-I]|nr:hypothetical protein BDV93DRAFT_474759 [Ceratobasidium sp. AG-I]